MRIAVSAGEKSFHIMLFNLYSQGGFGDYEGFADCELGLDLTAIAGRLQGLGFQLEGCNDLICRAQKNPLRVTIFPAGRLILEGVSPDKPSEALRVLMDILNLSSQQTPVEGIVT